MISKAEEHREITGGCSTPPGYCIEIFSSPLTKKHPQAYYNLCKDTADENVSSKGRPRKIGQYQGRIAVKLHIKVEEANLSEQDGQKETRAQDNLDSSKSGGASATIDEHSAESEI